MEERHKEDMRMKIEGRGEADCGASDVLHVTFPVCEF